MEFNINEYVSVKLNDIGRQILRNRHAELKARFPKLPDYTEPEVDADGYTKFRLWHLMDVFGSQTKLGMELPFETTIRI